MLPRVLRVFASILLFLSLFFMPFWVSVILVILGMVYFKYFIEGIILFILGDLLYGIPEPKFFGITFIMSAIAMAIFIFTEYMKTKLKYYP